MHQLETYSLITGALIDECFIAEEEIELPSSKYITFHPYHSKGNARQYDSWKEVVNLLKKSCPNYEMVQIGMENDDRYEVNTSLLGKTSYNSLAYLIKNCSLHLGYDSMKVQEDCHDIMWRCLNLTFLKSNLVTHIMIHIDWLILLLLKK